MNPFLPAILTTNEESNMDFSKEAVNVRIARSSHKLTVLDRFGYRIAVAHGDKTDMEAIKLVSNPSTSPMVELNK